MWWMGLAAAATLELQIDGLSSTEGSVVATLFTSADGFPAKPDRAARRAVVPAGQPVRFVDLPPGRYAVALFHDANDNGKIDSWWFGPPKEGLAASNNPTGGLGPPSFDRAAFDMTEADLSQTVTMSYLFSR